MITPENDVSPDIQMSIELLIKNIVEEMSLDILNKIESKKITEPLPVSKSSLLRGVNGSKLDNKTIRNIACLYYNVEDFDTLINLVPDYLKNTIMDANNKLTHQGVVSYEIARNPELVQLWHLCSGYGCTRKSGEKYFGKKFDTLIEILIGRKLITKSLLTQDCWIASGEMMRDREDFVYHYEHMFNLIKNSLNAPGEGKVVQFCGEMTKASFFKLQEKMVELYNEYVQADSLIESTEKEIKFNFQASLCAIGTNEVQDEIQ
jgi:hypothetical protein